MDLRTATSVKTRRETVEMELGVPLPDIGTYTLDDAVASTRHCENMIGATQIPLGIAGPLVLRTTDNGQQITKYIPLATTEGALVASVNRGCRAITGSGGAAVESCRVGATRGPVFKVDSLAENSALFEFLSSHETEIRQTAESTSHHLKYIGLDTNSVGPYRFVRFEYDTGDAMGLNMVTIATDEVVRYIEKETGARCVSLSGNYCVDKKASWQNVVRGRGFEVWAEAVIPGSVVESVLKTTPEAFSETWMAKCMVGSALTGSMGFNAQYANVLAALFIATGQDPAHVAECSVGITSAEVRPTSQGLRGIGSGSESLFISVFLPDVLVGTVGGGTGLATQSEALSILGLTGGNDGKNAQALAEITGAAVLAGELSLLASLSEGSLARAHQKLGRGGSVDR